MQILQYMRTNRFVGKDEAVAVALEDEMTFSWAEVKASTGSAGIKKMLKEFLAPTYKGEIGMEEKMVCN